jgi:predicted amidohydrolase YtcJ
MMHLAADSVLTNGNLITLDRARPRASAMAVRDGKIVAVGSNPEILGLAGEQTERIDLAGKTVVPGFCDSHLHLLWFGMQILTQADLVGCASVDEVLSRLSAQAVKSNGWIQGHGFDQSKMKEGRFPTRAELDRVSKIRPILISRVCGHAVVVNSAALTAVTESQRAAGDEQTGLYTENDSAPFYAKIPAPSEPAMQEAALAACRLALRTGITSVHTLLDTPEQMQAYSRLRRQGKLPIRVVGMPPYASVQDLHKHGINSTFGDDRLRFGAAKLFSDGSLGAQTALLSSPYADKPGELGIRIYDPEDLKRKSRDAQEKGFQLAIHAIGDQAVRESIDAIEYALRGESNELHRHRIEHASLVAPDCLERLAKLKIVVTCQPQFVTSDTWTGDRVGKDRVRWCYPFKTLLDAGVPITLSSDCPVEKLDAFDAIAAAVGRHPWSAQAERLSPEEAIRAYCLGSAYAAHMDDKLGSLEAGKLADFVVLSGDPTKMSASEIRQLSAERVYRGGEITKPP